MIQLRIGINLGDVIIEGDDIYGDGVNLATRLEALADPGGICISSLVHESLGNHVDANFADAGEYHLKNIDRPVPVWKWPANRKTSLPSGKPATATTEKFALAVSSLQSLTEGPVCSQFADGLTRELTAELGRFSLFEVVSAGRGARDRTDDTHALDCARSLNAEYVLGGGVQTAGQRIRVSVEIIDVETAKLVWSQRYEGDLGEVFGFQDETVQKICGGLYHPLMKFAAARANSKPPDGTALYDHYLQSFALVEAPTRAGVEEARLACLKVLETDPGFAPVYENLAWVNIHSAFNCWVEDACEALRNARRDAIRGVSIDGTEAYNRSALGLTEAMLGNHDKAEREGKRAVRLSPGDIEHVAFLGLSYAFAGRHEEAVEACERALKLAADWAPLGLMYGSALYGAGRLHDAIDAVEQFLLALPEYNYVHALLAACQYELGNMSAARESVKTIVAQSEFASIAYFRDLLSGMDPKTRDRLITALTASGLPRGENRQPLIST